MRRINVLINFQDQASEDQKSTHSRDDNIITIDGKVKIIFQIDEPIKPAEASVKLKICYHQHSCQHTSTPS
jgi:hypothetical protein